MGGGPRRIPGGGPLKLDEFLGLGPRIGIPFPFACPFITGRGGGPAVDMRGIGEDAVGEPEAAGSPLISLGLDWLTIFRLWKIA